MKAHQGAEPERTPKRPSPEDSPALRSPAPHADSAYARVVGNRDVVARLTDTRESLEHDAEQAAEHVSGPTRPTPAAAATASTGTPPAVSAPGRPLDDGTRHRLEQTLDADLRSYGSATIRGPPRRPGGSARGRTPHLNTKPRIAEADRIRVTAGLTHPEAAALEADRIAQLNPRLNEVPGNAPPGQGAAANVQSAGRAPTFTFETTMVPGPGRLGPR